MLARIRGLAAKAQGVSQSAQGVGGAALVTTGVWQMTGLGPACIVAGAFLLFAAWVS